MTCICLWAVAATACDVLPALRRLFHGQDESRRTAGLRVEVTPATGISILIDGVRVATHAPYVGKSLQAGPHRLEVRGMGYYPVSLPVTLVDDRTITIPVSLRSRPAGEPEPDEAAPREPAPVLPPPPAPPAPPLPAGVQPITLHVVAEPDVPLLVDGNPLGGKEIVLERVFGDIAVGVIALHYQFGGAGLFDLTVPDDGAEWYRDGVPFKAGGSFKLHRGATRLRRVTADGTDQSVALRR